MVSMVKPYLFNGATKALIDDLQPEAWSSLTGGDVDVGVMALYKTTAWLYGVINKIAHAAENHPRVLVDGQGNEVDESNLPFTIDINDLTYRSSLSLSLFATAYMFKVKQGNRIVRVRWLTPSTVTPEIDKETGLAGFKRQVGNKSVVWEYDPMTDTSPDGLIWSWLPGLVEVGPGLPPADVARDAANVLRQIDVMAGNFFERGAIAQHLVKSPINPPKAEKRRLRALLERVLFGGNKTGYSLEVVNDALTFEKIGSDPKDLEMTALDDGNREDISAVFQTPSALVTGDAGSLSRATLDRITSNWYSQQVTPQTDRIFSAFNHHLFNEFGLTLKTVPAALPVDQEEERQKAQAFSIYVASGVEPLTASAMLGLDIPEGMELMSAAPVIDDAPAPVVAEEDAEPEDEGDESDLRAAEFARLKNFVANGTHLKRSFQSDVLTGDEISQTLATLTGTPKQDTGQAKAFEEAMRRFDVALAQPQPQPITINLPDMTHHVTLPPTEFKQGDITVMVPEQQQPEINVNVPGQPAPDIVVNVDQPDTVVNVQPPDVTVVNQQPAVRTARETTNVVTDPTGRVVGSNSTTVYENE